jgi:hypothetical protein
MQEMPEKVLEACITDPDDEFNFEKLLDPYREGGTVEEPVRRTMGSMVDYLINKRKYPIEIVGAAILIVFTEMKNGRRFEGDGSYGSRGRELLTAIRNTCNLLNQNRLQKEMYQFIAENVFRKIAEWAAQEAVRQRKPWYRRLFSKRAPVRVDKDGAS